MTKRDIFLIMLLGNFLLVAGVAVFTKSSGITSIAAGIAMLGLARWLDR